MMYARHVTYTLKPNRRDDFIKAFDKEIVPLLQKQHGFTDVITLISPEGKNLIAISLWERKENADAFGRDVFPQALKSVAGTFDGNPEVRGLQVATSTFPKIAAAL